MPLITVNTPTTRLEDGHISITYRPRETPWEVSEERAQDAIENKWGELYAAKIVKPELEIKAEAKARK